MGEGVFDQYPATLSIAIDLDQQKVIMTAQDGNLPRFTSEYYKIFNKNRH
jgi:hypothetical protein